MTHQSNHHPKTSLLIESIESSKIEQAANYFGNMGEESQEDKDAD
jgi:hypothetical protein